VEARMPSFELDTGGGKICFAITVRDSLFVGAAKDDGVVESIHELKMDEKAKQFKIKGGQIWRRRSRTPLFERVALQFQEILRFLNLNKDTIQKAVDTLIEIALDLSKAEEALLDYVDTESAAVSRYQGATAINPQKNALVYDDPTLRLKEIAERILIRIIIAYRRLPEVISLIRGAAFTTGKTFIPDLANLLPADHPDRASFEYDNGWIKELYDLRGDIEHESWEVLPFEVNEAGDRASYHVEPCRVVIKSQGEKPIAVAAYLDATLSNMIGFIEDAVALAIVDKMPYPTRIVSVPEAQRPQRRHFKYVADLLPEVKDKLPNMSQP
jgi:hypothetical protein